MSNISFVKFQGTGNDLILIDDREGGFPSADPFLIQKMCHRQFGIGADGLILLQTNLDLSADFRMRIFNSDGREATSCGNGLRCLIRFLRDLSIVQEKCRIRTGDRVVIASMVQEMPVIDLGFPGKLQFEVATEEGIVHCIDTGAPHAVQFVSDIAEIDVAVRGARIRHLLETNVNFASFSKDRCKDPSIRVRTFEKGVEKETLSCGTGAAAVAVALYRLYGLKGTLPISVPGGCLNVWEEEGRVFLSGPAEKVFTGTYP